MKPRVTELIRGTGESWTWTYADNDALNQGGKDPQKGRER
jgi:hypothetical protein